MASITDNSSWLWVASALSLLAAIGGVVVLRGLWLEGYNRPENFKDVEEQRRHHKLEGRGIKWVFWGVLIEVVIALGMTFKEGWEAHSTALEIEKNNPWIKPIASASAKARIIFKWDKVPQIPDPMLIFKSEEDDSWVAWMRFNKGTNCFLQLMSPVGGASVWNMGSDVKRSCEISFGADPFGFASHDPQRENMPVEKFNEVDSMVIQIRPLATNIVVESGEVELIVNDLKWTFEIPPQRPKWGLITMHKVKNSAGKTVTNVLRIPVKDFVSPPRFPDSWYDGK